MTSNTMPRAAPFKLCRRVGHCFGLTLWQSRRVHLALWVCFGGLPRHTHPGQHVEVLPVFGFAEFCRVNPATHELQAVTVSPGSWGTWFSLPAGWPHWFCLRARPLIFVNRTFDGQNPADNFSQSP